METDRIKDLKIQGAGKFLHRIFLCLTYPFRHIFRFLIFVFIAFVFAAALPMSKGVPFVKVADWYLLKYQETSRQVDQKIQTVLPSPDDFFEEVEAPKIIRKNPTAKTESIRKNGFKRPNVLPSPPSADTPQADIVAAPQSPHSTSAHALKRHTRQKSPEISQTAEMLPETELAPKSEQADSSYYRKDERLPVIYEEEPISIHGQTIVFNASEMAVGDTYVILYGIYTDPNAKSAQQAFEYLKDMAEGKDISCKIIAYTPNHIATAVCFLEGQSLNKMMVEAGWAKNIAL